MDLPSAGGELKLGSTSHIGALFGSEEHHLRPRVYADLRQPQRNENCPDNPSHTRVLPTGTQTPSKASGWALELRDCGAIPGEVCC